MKIFARAVACNAALVIMLAACSAGDSGRTTNGDTTSVATTTATTATATTATVTGNGAAVDTSATADVALAIDVIRRYYNAIDARKYGEAWELWSDGGKSSGKSLADFTAGFANTVHTSVRPGTPGRIEGAAGSRYIDIPVVVNAELKDGTTQRFTGSYQLRRTVVDGATASQRAWHIYTAKLH